MKSQNFIILIAAIAIISLAFIPKQQHSNDEVFRDQWGTVISVDNVNGCMTLDLCKGGTFSFGIIAGGNGSFYPSVGTGIIAQLGYSAGSCNDLLLGNWIISECH